jgi:GNAT superfamily N-acetyltransferase
MKTGNQAQFLIRRAQPDEAPMIAWHRARMFQDMGDISDEIFEEFHRASLEWVERVFAAGEYIGWFAIPAAQPDVIVAGAGVHLRKVGPHPCRPRKPAAFSQGRHAIVVNVFTEPEWRRRGLAALLMDEIVVWARSERLDQLVLHASPEARSLYDKMGFVATTEMRFDRDLRAPP